MRYSEEEIKTELHNYRLPWLAKIWKKYGAKALHYSILPLFLTALTFVVIYNESIQIHDWMWLVAKGIVLLLIFGFGIFALLGHITELISTNKLRRKLGLSQQEFKNLVIKYRVTGL